MGDRIVVMHDGVVQQVGAPAELYNHPANLFVAGFLGSPTMNFFDGEFMVEDDAFVVRAPFGQVALGARTALMPSANGDRQVVCGIRPEDLALERDSPHLGTDGGERFRAVVDLVELAGADAYVSLTLGETLLQARVSADLNCREGQSVWVRLDPRKIHLFSKQTGTNLALAPARPDLDATGRLR